ncbi:MAG: glycosyltransferase [Planctomycetota bacterium]
MTRVLVSGVVLGQRQSGVRRFAANVLPRVAHGLQASGGELALLEPREVTGLATGNAIRSIPSRVPSWPPWRRALAERRALRAAWRDAHAAGAPFDVVLSGHLPLPRIHGARHVHLVHDLRALAGLGPLWKQAAAPLALRRAIGAAELVVCVGPSVRDEVLRRHPRARVRVLEHGGDHLPLLPRAPEDFALFVGHLEPRKNFELMLEAWRLDATLPELIVVGGGAIATAERAAAAAGLAQRITFVGTVDDAALARLYARAGCAVFPSRLEGFGLGLLEARRAGTPLAASSIPAHLERLEPDDPRFAVDDAPALARAVHAALERRDVPRTAPRTWEAAAAAWCALLAEFGSARA